MRDHRHISLVSWLAIVFFSVMFLVSLLVQILILADLGLKTGTLIIALCILVVEFFFQNGLKDFELFGFSQALVLSIASKNEKPRKRGFPICADVLPHILN